MKWNRIVPIPESSDSDQESVVGEALQTVMDWGIAASTHKEYSRKFEAYKTFCEDTGNKINSINSFAAYLDEKQQEIPGGGFGLALMYAMRYMVEFGRSEHLPAGRKTRWLYDGRMSRVIKGEQRRGASYKPSPQRGTITEEQMTQWHNWVAKNESEELAAAFSLLYYGQLRSCELQALKCDCLYVSRDNKPYLIVPVDKAQMKRRTMSDGTQKKLILHPRKVLNMVNTLGGERVAESLLQNPGEMIRRMRKVMEHFTKVTQAPPHFRYTLHSFRHGGDLLLNGVVPKDDEKTRCTASGQSIKTFQYYARTPHERDRDQEKRQKRADMICRQDGLKNCRNTRREARKRAKDRRNKAKKRK